MNNNDWGGRRVNSGRKKLDEDVKKNNCNIYINKKTEEDIHRYGKGNSFSQKVLELVECEIKRRSTYIK